MSKGANNKKGVVLIVDDEKVVRNIAVRLFEFLGYKTRSCASGSEALEVVVGDPTVGLVVLDYNMPGLNGMDTLALLRKTHPELPVLLSTGIDLDIDGPNVWLLRKPYHLETVESVLKEIPK